MSATYAPFPTPLFFTRFLQPGRLLPETSRGAFGSPPRLTPVSIAPRSKARDHSHAGLECQVKCHASAAGHIALHQYCRLTDTRPRLAGLFGQSFIQKPVVNEIGNLPVFLVHHQHMEFRLMRTSGRLTTSTLPPAACTASHNRANLPHLRPSAVERYVVRRIPTRIGMFFSLVRLLQSPLSCQPLFAPR